jgi:hypothetical protein
MNLQRIVKKLAKTGRVWVDWEQKALVLLDEEGIYSFRPNTTNRTLLLKFKSFVEVLSGEKLPTGVLGLQFVLSTLVTEGVGSLPHAPR